MPTLHLGVVDVPYNRAPSRRQRKVSTSTVTTGDVAGWLEDKYHVMEVFYREHEGDVAEALERSLEGSFQNLLLGAPAPSNPFASAESSIDDQFRKFLLTGEMEGLGYPGVPTQAALDRRSGKKRSARFKRRRPGTGVSFIDSGLYENSFKSWVD